MKTGQKYKLHVLLCKAKSVGVYESQTDALAEAVPISDVRMLISRYVPPIGWDVVRFMLEPVNA